MSISTIADDHWETRWIAPEGTFDPAYERTNVALRRWVDGMEQALLASAAGRGPGRSRGLSSSQTPNRR